MTEELNEYMGDTFLAAYKDVATKVEPDSKDAVEVAVIGTGLYGIQAVRYYLDIHPNANVSLLEADDVIGGAWSSSMSSLLSPEANILPLHLRLFDLLEMKLKTTCPFQRYHRAFRQKILSSFDVYIYSIRQNAHNIPS